MLQTVIPTLFTAKSEPDTSHGTDSSTKTKEDKVVLSTTIDWSKVDFYAPDSDSNVIYGEDKELKGGTPGKLIDIFTKDNGLDPNVLHDFLLTYRSYMNGMDLLQALIHRYETVTPDDSRVVRLRVFSLLKQWLDKYWEDFSSNGVDQLAPILRDFLEKVVNGDDSNMKKVAGGVKNTFEKRMSGGETKMFMGMHSAAPTPYPPKDATVTIFDMHPEEVARQITLMEWHMWSAIKPWECLGLAWTKKDSKERAKNVLQLSERFNYVSGWVATTLCTTEKLRDRVKILLRLIEIATRLRAMGNFNGVMEIVSGINRGPVFRMSKTLEAAQAKDKNLWKSFQELQELTDRDKNYANLRKVLKNSDPPVLPYLGMYLTDLTFIEEGNPDYLGEHKLVNFYKKRLISQTIKKIQQYQLKSYFFAEIMSIQVKLQGAKVLEENELYELSNWLEPRPGKEPGERPYALGGTKKTESEQTAPKIDLEFKKEWQVFYIKDSPSNIMFEPHNRVLAAATLPKIIERLTHPVFAETSSLMPFLAGYRYIFSPEYILDLLVIRYQVPDPKDKSELAIEKFTIDLKLPIQIRVSNIIKQWLVNYPNDFYDNPKCMQLLRQFYDNILVHETSPHASGLKLTFQKIESQYNQKLQQQEKSDETSSRSSSVSQALYSSCLDISPTQCAEHFTSVVSKNLELMKTHEPLVMAGLVSNIVNIPIATNPPGGIARTASVVNIEVKAEAKTNSGEESVESSKTEKAVDPTTTTTTTTTTTITSDPNENHKLDAHNLTNMLNFLETIENWILYEFQHAISQFPTTDNPDKLEDSHNNLAEIFCHIINIVHQCEAINNWQCMRSIVNGVDKSVRSNLDIFKGCWEKIPFSERKYFFEVRDILEQKNYRKYQNKMSKLSPPLLPVIEPVIDILSKMPETHGSDNVSDTMYNFSKMRVIGETLNNYTRLEKNYTFEPNNDIEFYILTKRELAKPVATANLPRFPNSMIAYSSDQSTDISPTALKDLLLQMIKTDGELDVVDPSEDPNNINAQFSLELNAIIKEVMSDEMKRITTDIKILQEVGALKKVEPKIKPAKVSIDDKALEVIKKNFPNCVMFTWNPDSEANNNSISYTQSVSTLPTLSSSASLGDSATSLSSSSSSLVTVIEKEKDKCHVLVTSYEKTEVDHVFKMVQVGKLYRVLHPNLTLACAIVTHDISMQAQTLAANTRIKVYSV
eukprot:TRINITY_DN577_c0_g1_i3.p1 TRINITY_DN577_c0_g1~~TRINITY_DN577_c0_g1_i3.p1  ORF type:complete len:1211 (-),score=280.78 TRINITY_DN577_c0_g1_i3:2634-6266(-)